MDADAIVVGAGAAGLAAARRLARASKRVIVVEARERAGGRVWPHSAVEGAAPGELGAEFIHGQAQLTYRLLREAGLTWDGVEGERWYATPDGALEREDDEFGSDAELFDGLDALPDDVSVDAFFARYERDAAMRPRIEAARGFIEGFDAADPRIASARAIAQEWRSGIDSTAARPRAGYGPAFAFLLAECAKRGADVRFSATVTRIGWGDGGVTVALSDAGGRARTLHARICVVTLPAGVLRQAGAAAAPAFDPPLPAEKRGALAAIEMGNAVKAVLWFRTRFWEGLAGGRYRNGAFFQGGGAFAVFWTALPRRDGPVTAWVGGPGSAALEGSPNAVVDRAVDEFGAIFGETELARKEFATGAAHDWRNDPFARGAYSYVRVGGGDARAVLGASLGGVLFFAGEATALGGTSGTVEGALESGERAGREALQALASYEGANRE